VTFLSGYSTAISPASSTPVGPPPMIRIDPEVFILVLSEIEKEEERKET